MQWLTCNFTWTIIDHVTSRTKVWTSPDDSTQACNYETALNQITIGLRYLLYWSTQYIMQYSAKDFNRKRTDYACKLDSDEVSVSLVTAQTRDWALWIDENLLTDAAGTTSLTQSDWCVNWPFTVNRVTLRWISGRIVFLTVASFSGQNIHNFTNSTFIYNEVLTSWICSSTAMKGQCVYTCNTDDIR